MFRNLLSQNITMFRIPDVYPFLGVMTDSTYSGQLQALANANTERWCYWHVKGMSSPCQVMIRNTLSAHANKSQTEQQTAQRAELPVTIQMASPITSLLMPIFLNIGSCTAAPNVAARIGP